jgi:PAS domain S-box-containing protein
VSTERHERRVDALDHMPSGVFVLDSNYRVVFWNRRLETWTGVARGSILGCDARDRFPALNADPYDGCLARLFREGGSAEFSPPDVPSLLSCEIAQHVAVASVPAPGGGFQAVFSIQDVTDLAQQFHENRRAKAAADAAGCAKGELLANMSHEIRTPINAIAGLAGLLLDSELTARQRRHAELLKKSASSLLAILNDTLDYAKIEADRMELESADFDLREVVEEVADLTAACAQKKGVEVVCSIDPDVPTRLQGDAARLRQILMNLTANAVKFTHEGEISIRARIHGGQDAVLFAIADTGIGVSEDKAQSLFRPFAQADPSITRRYGGSGLGLSIVARLVELMGGEVGFESEEGKGSRFWFTARLEQKICEWPRPPVFAGARVLLVDDRASVRAVLAERLRFWRCSVVEAADVETAVARLASADLPFEAVLVDLDMPGVSGGCLPALARRHAPQATAPMLLMTSVAETADVEHWRASGFADRVTKPVKPSELAAALSRLIAGRPEMARPDVAIPGTPGAPRILLVEGDPVNQEVTLGILEGLGYAADAAFTGSAAVIALSRTDYDLVLMDCQLPDLDGYETARLIRWPASPVRDHDVPIIAVTGGAMEEDRAKRLAAGMNDYLVKPLDSNALELAIERCVSARRRKWAACQQTAPAPAEPAAPPVFNGADLMERLGGNRELALRVLGVFLTDMPAQIAALAQAVERGDRDQGRRGAHAIKGASANAGAEQLRALALRVEELCRAGDPGAAPFAAELESCFARAACAIEEFRSTRTITY